MNPSDAQRALRQGGNAAAASIRGFLEGLGDAQRDHEEWALVCEEAGLVELAFKERVLAVRHNPQSAAALRQLGASHEERGELERARLAYEACIQLEPRDEEAIDGLVRIARESGQGELVRRVIDDAVRAGVPQARIDRLRGRKSQDDGAPIEILDVRLDLPDDATLARMLGLFRGREDTHARQWHDPHRGTGYTPVREPMTPSGLRNHLLGNTTLGSYPIRLDETVTYFAIDIDIAKPILDKAATDPAVARAARHAVHLAGLKFGGALRRFGFSPILEDSGHKGRHLWVFFSEPIPSEAAYKLGRLLSVNFAPELDPMLHLEFFPKQPALSGKGLGNLIKIPLGVHRRTGKRSVLLDATGRPLESPHDTLRDLTRTDRTSLTAALDMLGNVVSKMSCSPRALSSPPVHTATSADASTLPALVPPDRWTDADFELDPEVAHVLSNCPVLGGLRRRAEETRSLTREELKVLKFTLGHVKSGPLAVNHILSKCHSIAPVEHLKRQLQGHPMACENIRKNVPHIASKVACNCPFLFAPDQYPTPTLHLLTMRSAKTASLAALGETAPSRLERSQEEIGRRYGMLLQRLNDASSEFEHARHALLHSLREQPNRTLEIDSGRFVLREVQGVEEILWLAHEVSV